MRPPWPEHSSTARPTETVRRILDYLVWISVELSRTAFHGEADREIWRLRVHRAYQALFLPPLAGRGDPYPPDIPPAERPGVWPDVPAASIPGMTVRHQVKVIGLLAEELRDRAWGGTRPIEVEIWDRRLATAREILDHGPQLPLPEQSMTSASEGAMAAAKAQEEAVAEHTRKRVQGQVDRLRAEAHKRAEGRKAAALAPARDHASPPAGPAPTSHPPPRAPERPATGAASRPPPRKTAERPGKPVKRPAKGTAAKKKASPAKEPRPRDARAAAAKKAARTPPKKGPGRKK